MPGTPYVCQGLETADDINRTDILEAYQRYYLPNNMTLIVVGDFDTAEMKKNIASTFAEMEAGDDYQRPIHNPEPNTRASLLTSTLSPLVDDEALVGVAYASAGSHSDDYYPRLFIENYLADRLYKKLRVEAGLSYSPAARTISYPDTDVWYVYADTDLDAIGEVLGLIQTEIDALVQQPIDEEQLSLGKDKLLMSVVQGYESNAGMADYYTGSLHELEKYGALIREEEEINALSVADVQRVSTDVFGKAPAIVFHNTPTMTHTQLGVALGIIGLVLLWFLGRRFLQHRRKARLKRVRDD